MILMQRIATVGLLAATLFVPATLGPAWGQAAGGAPKQASAPACDRAEFQVIVDVGHTAESPGAVSSRGFREYDFNLRLAKEIEQKLIEAGFAKTMLLVTEGKGLKGLFKRVLVANGSHADLFLSIHHDSVPNYFLEKWEYEGHERGFSDRFNGKRAGMVLEGGGGSSFQFTRDRFQDCRDRGDSFQRPKSLAQPGAIRPGLVSSFDGCHRAKPAPDLAGKILVPVQ